MRVNIEPQWQQLADWYWDQAGGSETVGMSIWGVLERDYGVRRAFPIGGLAGPMWVVFPDEKSYTAFLLRWL